MRQIPRDIQNRNAGRQDLPQRPRVPMLRKLLGDDAVFIAWPLGCKGDATPWRHLTRAHMDDNYVAKLERGNIGVVLGEKSGGLCSIDLDTDEVAEQFIKVNPALQTSLRTRGKRGCNVWVRIVGDYPAPYKFKAHSGEFVGEWRANGNQTIISGTHPDTGTEYQRIVDAKPVSIAFSEIVWPDNFQKKAKTAVVLPAVHSNTATQRTQQLSNSVTQATQVGIEKVCFAEIRRFIPTGRSQSDTLLFAMAGYMLTLQNRLGRKMSKAERTQMFEEWWKASEKHTDPEMDYYSYLGKWQRNCETRKSSDEDTPPDVAWRMVQSEPWPPDATKALNPPATLKMQQLIALCYFLQRLRGQHNFYLGSRDAARLLEMPHMTVYYWLERLSDKDNPDRVLEKKATGSYEKKLASEYRYIGEGVHFAAEVF